MKKITYLLVLPLVALLASCNSSNNGGGDNGDLEYDENNEIVYNDVNLKMWSVTTGDDANTQDSIISEFNTMYNGHIHVEVEHYSRYDLETLLSNTLEFDKTNAPDMLFNHGSRVTEYNERGWVKPVKNYFDKSGAVFEEDDFVPSLLESVTIGNDIYGMPIDCHSAVVCYRKDILDKNGLKVPTNYQELCEVCDQAATLAANNNLWIRGENSDGYKAYEWRKASTATNYTAFPISYGDMWVHEFVDYTAGVQNGGSIVDKDGMPAWDTQENANGLQVLKDWIFPSNTSTNKQAMSIDYGSSYDVGDAPFNKGEGIFKLQGPWAWQNELTNFDALLAKDGGSSNIDTMSLSNLFAKDQSKDYASKIKGEGHAITILNTCTSMTKCCAASLFMEYMAENSGVTWAKRGHLPALKSVSKSSEYLNDPAYDEYISKWGSAEDYVVVGPSKYYSYIDTYYKEASQKSISGNYKTQNIKDILDSEYKDCKDYIELYA